MNNKQLILICITVLLSVAVICSTLLYINYNDNDSNTTSGNTAFNNSENTTTNNTAAGTNKNTSTESHTNALDASDDEYTEDIPVFGTGGEETVKGKLVGHDDYGPVYQLKNGYMSHTTYVPGESPTWEEYYAEHGQ